MKAFALLLLLLPLLCLGQTVVVPKAQDPDHRDHWPNGAAITPGPDESVDHASMHALPIGTGAAPDGGAWLRVDERGTYTIHNASINELRDNEGALVKPPFNIVLRPGQLYRVLPHPGPLYWTPPSGVKGVVPNANLIPPVKP